MSRSLAFIQQTAKWHISFLEGENDIKVTHNSRGIGTREKFRGTKNIKEGAD